MINTMLSIKDDLKQQLETIADIKDSAKSEDEDYFFSVIGNISGAIDVIEQIENDSNNNENSFNIIESIKSAGNIRNSVAKFIMENKK